MQRRYLSGCLQTAGYYYRGIAPPRSPFDSEYFMFEVNMLMGGSERVYL